MTKRKPTFKGFISWLKRQDPHRKYQWGDCQDCPIAQYLKTVGIEDLNELTWDTYNKLEGGDYREPCGNVAMSSPWTFGAALKRAELLLANSAH